MAVSQAVLELLVTMKDEVSSSASSIGSSLGTLGTIAGGVALAGVAALGAALVSGVGDAREAAQVMAQTEAVIKSTGGAAGFTAKEIADMAGELSAASGKSLFGDDDIQKGQNLLLTFTNISETLPDATQTMLDMAQALGTDASGSAIQLGKALNDPIKGISALTKVGVTFTEEQKNQIKTMQDAGDMAGAQQVILAELNKEFGGSAEAAAKADGGWAQFADRMGEAKEAAGAALLPLLGILASFLNDTVMPVVEATAAAFADWLGDPATQEGIRQVGDAIQNGLGVAFDFIVNTAFPLLMDAWANLQPILADLVAWFEAEIPVAIAALVGFWNTTLLPIFDMLAELWVSTLQPAIADLVGWLKAEIPIAIAILTAYWNTTLLPIFDNAAALWSNTLQPALADLLVWFKAEIPVAIATLATYWNTTLLPIFDALVVLYTEHIEPVLVALVGWLARELPPAIAALAAFWRDTLQPALAEVAQFIAEQVIPTIGTLIDWLAVNLPPAIETVANFLTDTLFPALQTFYEFVKTNVVPVLLDLIQTIGTDAPKGIEVVVAAWGDLKTAMSNFKTDYIDPVVRGWNEVITAVQSAYDWFGKIGESINSIQIPDWLQGHSPPPLANWFSDIAGAATAAQGAAGDLGLGGDVGALPAPAFAGGGGAGVAPISLTINIQGSVTTERDLVLAIRDGLVELGNRNVSTGIA